MVKYNEIMGRVKVTDKMQSRILNNADSYFKKKESIKRRSSYLVLSTIAAAAVFVLIIRPWNINDTTLVEPVPYEQDGSVLSNPFGEDYSCAEELSEAAGFEVPELKNLPFEVEDINYSVIGGDLAQIQYFGKNNDITYRKSGEEADNSGDYNNYNYTEVIEVNNIKITVKGEKKLLKLAIWTDGKYAHSIYADKAVTKDDMVKMVKEIINK